MRMRLAVACALALALIVVAAASSGGFKQPSGAPFATGADPQAISAADVNGDGKADIVTLDNDGSHATLHTFIGNGTGGFKAFGTPAALADSADAFSLGDLNGDHRPDAVVTNYDANSVSVFLNDGHGSFTQHGSPVTLHGGSQPETAAFADLDGDGKLDVIVPNQFVAGVDFLKGDGSGGLTAFASSPFNYSSKYPGDSNAFAAGPILAVAAKLDDGNTMDVAVVNYNGNSVSILAGNGDGSFTPLDNVLVNSPGGLVAGDFNGDGVQDLVVGDQNGNLVRTFFGNGDGTFTAGPTASTPTPCQLVSGDFNGDKRPDLATLDCATDGYVDVLLGDGHGAFAEEPGGPFAIFPNPGSPSLYAIAGADFNGDKRSDLAGVNYNLGSADVLLHQGGALPSASSITPSAALAGDSIVIKGASLDTVALVGFGGASGEITAQSATSLTVTVPDDAELGKLILIGANGSALSAPTFTPIVAPSISSLSPSPGTKAGGSLTINGSHFTGTTTVTFGGVPATKFVVNSDAKITATVPVGAGSPIEVTNPADHDDTPFVLIVPPEIDNISPSHGPANKGATTTVFVSGHHLQGVTSVLFHGKPGTNVSVSIDGESLQADAPVGATTGTISVKNIADSATSAQTFTVDPPPTVSSFTPLLGTPSTTVTITGKGFTNASGVKFGTFLQTSLTVNSDTSITTTVPGLATIGKLTVVTPSGLGVSAATFTAVVPPHIDTLAPSVGIPGTVVTINGSHFIKATSVTFNGVAATFSVVSDTKITTKMPVGATTGQLTVTNAAGSNDSLFTLVESPVLGATGSFTPTAGGPNQMVTISGSHFAGVKSVTFNGKPAASFTVDDDTQITAHVAAGSGTGVIKVTNAAGFDATTDKFTLVTITSFSPTTTNGSGGTFTVNGSGLSAVTKIVFFGTFGTQFSPNPGGTDTKLTFPIWNCGSTGSFHLVVPGAFDVISATPLTYTGPACT